MRDVRGVLPLAVGLVLLSSCARKNPAFNLDRGQTGDGTAADTIGPAETESESADGGSEMDSGDEAGGPDVPPSCDENSQPFAPPRGAYAHGDEFADWNFGAASTIDAGTWGSGVFLLAAEWPEGLDQYARTVIRFTVDGQTPGSWLGIGVGSMTSDWEEGSGQYPEFLTNDGATFHTSDGIVPWEGGSIVEVLGPIWTYEEYSVELGRHDYWLELGGANHTALTDALSDGRGLFLQITGSPGAYTQLQTDESAYPPTVQFLCE